MQDVTTQSLNRFFLYREHQLNQNYDGAHISTEVGKNEDTEESKLHSGYPVYAYHSADVR